MRRLACCVGLGLLAILPTLSLLNPTASAQLAPPRFQPQPLLTQPAVPYTAPKADGAVVELLDEGVESLFPQLMNDGGGEAGTVQREDRDVFAGVEATRVTPMQKYRSEIPGWSFKIVETPKNAGEFRYLRFAWKKIGGTGIMIQFHDTAKSWGFRFYAGQNVFGWVPATQVDAKLTGDWVVVTRDLFKEFGAFTISGFALTPLDGTAGLFDHMLLGRTVEDLDKATATALGKTKPAAALAGKERDGLWADMIGTDVKKASPAFRAFLASAADQVTFIRERLSDVPVKDDLRGVPKLIADLDAEKFDTREDATAELIKLGAPVIDAVREAARNAPNDEVRFRCRVILKGLGVTTGAGAGGPVSKAGRMSRVVRVLERADTADARTLLEEIAAGKLAPEAASDAKAALTRLPKKP